MKEVFTDSEARQIDLTLDAIRKDIEEQNGNWFLESSNPKERLLLLLIEIGTSLEGLLSDLYPDIVKKKKETPQPTSGVYIVANYYCPECGLPIKEIDGKCNCPRCDLEFSKHQCPIL